MERPNVTVNTCPFNDSDMVSTTPSAGSALAMIPFSLASNASVKALVSALPS